MLSFYLQHHGTSSGAPAAKPVPPNEADPVSSLDGEASADTSCAWRHVRYASYRGHPTVGCGSMELGFRADAASKPQPAIPIADYLRNSRTTCGVYLLPDQLLLHFSRGEDRSMLRYAAWLVVLGGVSVSLAEDGTRSLEEAVKAVNEQAAEWPETRGLGPLTEDEAIQALKRLSRRKPPPVEKSYGLPGLSDEEFRGLKRIVETRRLPKEVILRQFVRYDDGTCVEHGWWVRLVLMRAEKCPFSLTVREQSVFRRPYTQKEREFHGEMRRTGAIPTMGRLVAYFDEDPKFGAVREFSAEKAHRLAEAVKKAVQGGKAEDFLKSYDWEGVDEATRTWVREEAEQLSKRRLSGVSVEARRYSGRLENWRGFQIWDPNLRVRGYVVLDFADEEVPRSIWLEFGETEDGARLVNYVVSKDLRAQMIGKPLSGGGIRVQAFQSFDAEKGRYELFSQIDAPDELPALRKANLEVWKINARPAEASGVEKAVLKAGP